MGDQPKAPKGQEWYYRPGTTEPELRDAEQPEEEAEKVEEPAEETVSKPAAKKPVAKKK